MTTLAITGGQRAPISSRRLTLIGLLLILVLAIVGGNPASASADRTLRVTTQTPDYVTAGKGVLFYVNILNTGSEPLEGDLSIRYVFPEGIVPAIPQELNPITPPQPQCNIVAQVVECTHDVNGVAPGETRRLKTIATADPTAAGLLSPGEIMVSGGGSPGAFVEPISITAGSRPPFAIEDFDVDVADGTTYPSRQAGSVPDAVTTAAELPTEAQSNYGVSAFATNAPLENFRDVIVHVPPGLIGNPTATPRRCTGAELANVVTYTTIPSCPLESQIGLVQVVGTDIVPLYNVEPPAGSPAAFGFSYQSVVVTLLPRVRPSDHGFDIVTRRTASSVPLPKFEVSFWGVPADPSHDPLRGVCLQGGYGYDPLGYPCPMSAPRVPFLRTPTSCPGTKLPWSIEMDSYQAPGTFVSRSAETEAMEGCERLPFDPRISLAPSERSAGAPSGLDVNLTMPQDTGPDGLAQADLRAATVTMPQGVVINPASADGLAACSDAQLRLGEEGPSECPDAAKLGTVEVDTPLLDHPLGGSVFLRSQASSDPRSGDLYRLAIELRNDRDGLAIKLPGSLRADPDTGRLTASFADLPQLPFEAMRLHFKTGPRAPLTTPQTCGDYVAQAVFTGWNGAVVPFDAGLSIDRNCTAPGFAPGFQAGVANATAGAFSPFTLRVTRDPGQPNLSRIDATLPEGELAKLSGVPLCPDIAAGAGTCPAGSRIGRTVVGVGEGGSPLYVPQPGKSPTAVYLAGPYKGAPYSVVAAVPAQAGPFDLGTIAVRSALHVDPVTTEVTVKSDVLPQIVGGIPIGYRDVRVEIDRPGFTLNPTDCEPMAVTGTISSAAGGSARVSDRFQLTDCGHLGFKPKLTIGLRGQTRRAGHPALTAVLKMPQDGANIARTSVALPHSEFLAQSHIQTSCTRVQYAAQGGGGAGCPKGSVYGRARAFSPLLDRPLEGRVYLRSNGGDRELPDLVASLDGQIHVDLVGFIDVDKRTEGLRTTFANVPDAPVSKFVLKMPGGKKSLLENSTNICRGKHRAVVKFNAQNGRVREFRPLLKAKCGKRAGKARSSR